jgi:predicted transcriptional regulator
MKTQHLDLNTTSGELDQTIEGNYESDVRDYMSKKYDYIPLSPKLIEHVRRLDSLNVSKFVYFLICLPVFF